MESESIINNIDGHLEQNNYTATFITTLVPFNMEVMEPYIISTIVIQ